MLFEQIESTVLASAVLLLAILFGSWPLLILFAVYYRVVFWEVTKP